MAPTDRMADLPGTDSMAQALGGIAEAYSTPGQKLRTGIVSVRRRNLCDPRFWRRIGGADHARATGVGQKVDCSLLGGQIRLMGWTLTTRCGATATRSPARPASPAPRAPGN